MAETPEGIVAFDGEVPEDGHCRMIDNGDVIHLIFPGRQTASIHAGEGWAEIRVRPGHEDHLDALDAGARRSA